MTLIENQKYFVYHPEPVRKQDKYRMSFWWFVVKDGLIYNGDARRNFSDEFIDLHFGSTKKEAYTKAMNYYHADIFSKKTKEKFPEYFI